MKKASDEVGHKVPALRQCWACYGIVKKSAKTCYFCGSPKVRPK